MKSNSLERVLQEQLALYEKYLELASQDAELMAKLKIDELERNNKLKTTIVLKLQAMDEARQNVVRQIAKAFNLKEEKIRVEDLCRVLSTSEGNRLMELRQKLRVVIQKAKDIQSNTTALAHASLGWVNGSMAALSGLMGAVATYNPQGKVPAAETYGSRSVEKRV